MAKITMVPILMTADSGCAMDSGMRSVELKVGISYLVEEKMANILYSMRVAVPQLTPGVHLQVLHVNHNANTHCMAPSIPATITS